MSLRFGALLLLSVSACAVLIAVLGGSRGQGQAAPVFAESAEVVNPEGEPPSRVATHPASHAARTGIDKDVLVAHPPLASAGTTEDHSGCRVCLDQHSPVHATALSQLCLLSSAADYAKCAFYNQGGIAPDAQFLESLQGVIDVLNAELTEERDRLILIGHNFIMQKKDRGEFAVVTEDTEYSRGDGALVGITPMPGDFSVDVSVVVHPGEWPMLDSANRAGWDKVYEARGIVRSAFDELRQD